MRGGVLALAGAAAVAGAVVLAASTFRPEARATAAAPSTAPAARMARAGNRIFLTKAQLDQAIASGTLDRPVKSLLAVKAPLHFGDYSWDDRGVPSGPIWIRVDLRSQLMSVFRGGDEIGTAVVVYGGDNKQTPLRQAAYSWQGARPPFLALRCTNALHAAADR